MLWFVGWTNQVYVVQSVVGDGGKAKLVNIYMGDYDLALMGGWFFTYTKLLFRINCYKYMAHPEEDQYYAQLEALCCWWAYETSQYKNNIHSAIKWHIFYTDAWQM